MWKRAREQEMADAGAGPKKRGPPQCPHLPPYAEARAVELGDFTARSESGETKSFPEGPDHFSKIGSCQGTRKDNGEPCDCRRMLENRFLPLTKLQKANGEIFKFTSWRNPLACRTPADVVRGAHDQVEADKRGWHKFWYAVHHLAAHVSGQQHASEEKIDLWFCWLTEKAKDFGSNMSDFQNAGLLVEGGPRCDTDVRDKFTRAQQLLQHYNLGSSAKTIKRKNVTKPPSSEEPEPNSPKSAMPDADFEQDKFEASGSAKRVKVHVKMPQSPSPAPQDFSVVSPQSLACPQSGGSGEGVIAAYNQTQQYDSAEALADSFWAVFPPDGPDADDGGGGGGGEAAAAAGARGSEEGGQGGLEMYPDLFSPMFLVLLDAMHNVQFSEPANAERVEWATFDPQEFFAQGGADLHLAQFIGGYLHSNILLSPTLNEFFGALPQSSYGLSEQFQRLLTVPRSAAVAGSMSAIYCFWRIQQELLHLSLHPMYTAQLTSWYSVQESLLEILTELQQGAPEDQICSGLQGLFDMMNRKVRLGLKELHGNFAHVHASRRFNTGSFAEVVWAPRIWCFFVMLRLRHDEDFSRALWDKGFRFVACDLDPAAAAAEKESVTEEPELRSSAVLADGAGGGGGGEGAGGGLSRSEGGGVVAANPFAEDTSSPEMLVARLLKEEGREVDDEARAADGEVLSGLPPLSKRVSKTRQRMALLYEKLPLIPRPPPAAQAATSEFMSLINKLSSCRQSEREAMDLLGKDTYDMIFKAGARSPVKGSGGATRSTRGTRGGGGSQEGQIEEKIEVERVLNDLHDFRDASGFWTSDWLLQVTVKQHDGKDDKEGEHIDTPKITKGPKFRLYSVDPDLLIRVTVKNLSSTRDISLMPVYVKDNGEEEPEDLVELKSGECFELPFPLQKEAGEEEDGWAIKDKEGKTVLKLRFALSL